jgi:integrase
VSLARSHTIWFVKRPGGARKSFAILGRTTLPGGKPRYETKKLPALKALNTALKGGALGPADCELQVEALCASLNEKQRLKERGRYVANEANLSLLKQYWEEAYARRKNKDREASYGRLAWAISKIGDTSLLASVCVLQKKVDGGTQGKPRIQRRLCSALNQMRAHFGLKERLSMEKPTRPKFKYLTLADWQGILPHLDEPHRAFFGTLFGTGARTGEGIALEPEHVHGEAVQVLGQINRRGNEVETKTGNIRKTVCLGEFASELETWTGRKAELLPKLSCRTKLAARLKRACKKAFPNSPNKWIPPKDLRHSFAVECARRGLSIGEIAKLLGNSEQVCAFYYLPYVIQDDVLMAVAKKLRSRE